MIINNINNKKYVGQTNNIERRWKEHKSLARTGNYKYKSILYDAMRKYGIEKFEIKELEKCLISDLENKEKHWITLLQTTTPNGYNILKGGRVLNGIDNPFYNKTHSDYTKQLISIANSGRVQTESEIEMRKIINKGSKNPFYNKHHTNETKELIKQQLLNNLDFIETQRNKMIINNPNKNGQYSKRRKIDMLELTTFKSLKTFKSVTEAGLYIVSLNITNAKHPDNAIRDVCKGRMNTAYGFIWKYIDN